VTLHHVPREEWRECLERFSRAHRAWLATVHRVAAEGTVGTVRLVALDSLTIEERATRTVVELRFLDGRTLRVDGPRTMLVQATDAGAERALEIEAAGGVLLRLAFRAAAVPHEVDGLAPNEAVELEVAR
jgi:hypothetical protein